MSPVTDPPAAFDALALGTEIQRRIGVKTSRDEPLARFTTLRLGGPADLFAVAHNAFELRKLVQFARARGLAHAVLGRGSNVVIADAGIRGLVIQDRAEGAEIVGELLVAEAGLPMARAATVSQAAGLSGTRVRPGHPGHGRRGRLGECRRSRVEHRRDPRRGPAAGRRRVGRGDRRGRAGPRLPRQPAEARRAGRAGRDRPGGDVPARAGRARRDQGAARGDQALAPGPPAAGHAERRFVFRNPLPDSAGRLIDAAGLKGLRVGGASVSEKHANFLVNDRQGSATDLRRLADQVRTAVLERTGVQLVEEVVYLGDWQAWDREAAR